MSTVLFYFVSAHQTNVIFNLWFCAVIFRLASYLLTPFIVILALTIFSNNLNREIVSFVTPKFVKFAI